MASKPKSGPTEAWKTSIQSKVKDKFGKLQDHWQQKLRLADESKFQWQISEFELH